MGMFFNSMRKPRGAIWECFLKKNLSRKISVASLLKEQRT